MTRPQRWKYILATAWPLIIANGFWNLQLTIDRVFLGQFSTEALGAAMAVMGVFWVPMALLQGTANYVATFVAQYYGAQEKSRIGASVWQALYVSVIGGVIFLGLNFLSPWFFKIVGHSLIFQTLEVEYYNSVAYSALPTALVAAASGFFTGLGQTRTVIGINLVGLILNALLDYVMIFGKFGFPGMGVAGAGYATSIATYGAAVYGLYLIFQSKHEMEFRVRSDWKLNPQLLGQFLRFGLPSGLQWALEGMAFTVFLIIMGQLPNGDVALASSSIAVTVMMLSVLPSLGVAQAVMALVGQRLGEKNPDEAEKMTWGGVQVCCFYMAVVGLSFYLAPGFYLSWFQNEENAQLWSDVASMAASILKIVAVFTAFDSIYLNVSFALKGAGDTRFVSAVALLLPWPLFVLPAYLLRSTEYAVLGSWGFVAAYSLITVGVISYRFRRGHWRTLSVIHPTS